MHAPSSHVWKLQVLESKCRFIEAWKHWDVSNRNIDEELWIPLFADHVRLLTDTLN